MLLFAINATLKRCFFRKISLINKIKSERETIAFKETARESDWKSKRTVVCNEKKQ